MAKIIDPDLLVRSTTLPQLGIDGNIWIDTATFSISTDIFGSLSADGVSIQAFYSYLKEEWKTDPNLIKFPFPMVAITPEQFEFVDTWQPANIETVNLFRDGGFAVKNADGTSSSEFAGIITLGSIGGADQVYFQQTSSGHATNVVLPGAVNQCVKVYGNSSGNTISFDNASDTISSTVPITTFAPGEVITVTGSVSNNSTYTILSISPDYLSMVVEESGTLTDEAAGANIEIVADARQYYKIFVREQAKLYAQSELGDIGVATFTYQAYRFPLANADDLKITHVDTEIDADTNGTADTGLYADMSITYYASPQSRIIGASAYDFDVIIDADVANNGAYPSAEEIYEFVEWSLRQNSDIDAGAGSVIGKTASSLLKFVGDTLVTSQGVFIDDFSSTDINRLEFYDNTGVKRVFPFVAAGSINFNQNLVDDSGAVYRMFFTDANGNNFGDVDALIVQDNEDVDIAGNVTGSEVQFTFDYDGNVQGGRTSAQDAAVTVVAIGLDKAQYVKATSTIGRSNANSVSLVASLERNYSNPA
jgi:hypothetical protein